jgi:iron complex transport system substrate-binding protein
MTMAKERGRRGISRLVWLALLLTLGCGANPPAAPSGPVGRVVSLAPSVTEVMYALGAGDRIVGVCGQCNYPEAVTRVPRVGGYLAPSVEAVLGARPDLVVVVPSPGNREAVRGIERAGLRVLVVRDRTLDDLWAQIRALAAALDVADTGERLVADVMGRLDEVRRRVAPLPRQRALLVVGHSPLIVAGHGTLQDELLALAGGDNVAADAGGAWPQLSLELVVARAPEVILDAAMGTEEGGRQLFAQLTTVPAVQRGRIVAVGGDALFRAGPRVAEAAAMLAAAIHR